MSEQGRFELLLDAYVLATYENACEGRYLTPVEDEARAAVVAHVSGLEAENARLQKMVADQNAAYAAAWTDIETAITGCMRELRPRRTGATEMTDAELIRELRVHERAYETDLLTRAAAALSRAAGEIERAKGERAKLRFPTMLRKMWSGGEVQAWLDDQLNQPPDERPTKEETSAVVQLMREKRELLKANGYLNVERDKAVDRALSAEAEAAALRADAERYRFVRVHRWTFGNAGPTAKGLDVAIDAALAARPDTAKEKDTNGN